MKKNIPIIIGVGLIIIFVIILLGSTINKNTSQISVKEDVNNVEVRDGIQYITINARGGYSPRLSEATAGIPTKLIIKTNGTFDCSSVLKISALNFQKVLPNTGNTEIDVGIPKKKEPLLGICGMGMYNFSVNFK